MDIRTYAQVADGKLGVNMPAEAYKAWAAREMERNPNVARRIATFCQAHGVAKGNPIRIRPDYRYSRVGVAFDAAGALQASNPPALYSVGIGGNDPVLGSLDANDTNQNQGGRQDSAEMFVAKAHGFTIDVLAIGAATTPDGLARAIQRLGTFVSAILHTGTQTQQEWPPLKSIPGLNTGFQNGGAGPGAVSNAAAQGGQSLCRLDPNIILGAGESYKIDLLIKRFLGPTGAVPTFPADADVADTTFAISHTFYGQSHTGIAG